MARAGAFNGTDVVLTWHPGSRNQAALTSTLANINAKFRFSRQPRTPPARPRPGARRWTP